MTLPEPGSPTKKGVARIGTLISGRYLVRELLGEGGMGAVYLAEHTHMKKRVALKLLHPELLDNPEVSARFEREAMAAAHLEHPNVAAATDFGKTDDGALFLVLEYIEGTNLRDALATGPLSVSRALRITRQIALALDRAHDAGIVHRDLKPENVMLVNREHEPDFVKVLDFGIAKVLELSAASASGHLGKKNQGQVLTRLGTILGTPEYMAPEQALGEAVTPAADLYGVGVMLYEMLTGLHPFDPPDRTAMLSFHIVAPVPPMRDRAPHVDVPATVESIVRCLLEKDSSKRYANARALVDAIDSAASASEIELTGSSRASGNARGAKLTGAAVPPLTPWNNDPSAPGRLSPAAFATTSIGEPVPGSGRVLSPAPVATPMIEEAPRSSVVDSLRRQPRKVLYTVAAALPLGFILVVALAMVATRSPETNDAPSSTSRTTGFFAPAKSTTASSDRVDAAIALGPDALEALAKEYPEDTSVLSKLAQAYQAHGRPTDAMRTARTLLTRDTAFANDDAIVQLVAAIASRAEGDADDDAFALLEGPLGQRGVDALIDLTARGPGREIRDLRARAAKSLAKPEVRTHASPAAAVYLDLKGAQSCTAKRELLERVKDQGDARLLPSLKSLKATRGCGFLSRSDCWGCLRRDGALDEAMVAVEARPSPK